MLRPREEDRAGITDYIQVTEWNEFRALDLDQLKARMCGDVLVDLRNIYLPVQAEEAGFTYAGIIGRSDRGLSPHGNRGRLHRPSRSRQSWRVHSEAN